MYKQITTLEAAIAHLNQDIVIPDLSKLPSKFSKGVLALLKLQIITEAVNNDVKDIPVWEADYNNREQKKWFPWYLGGDSSGAGFRFSGSYCDWAATGATGGARLALKDEARADHMNEYFQDLYKDLYLIMK